jgi:hypothetical protein
MLGTFVAGRYSSTYQPAGGSATSLGILEEGYHLSWSFHKDVMNKTDAYGSTPIEAFHQGLDVGISGVCKEHLAAVYQAMAPHTTWFPTGASTFLLGVIGSADTDKAGILILTSTAGTPAAASPTTLTATYAMQKEGAQPSILFGPTHRVHPFDMRIYPFLSSTIRFFTST